MSTHNFETFRYTPVELAESMTATVHDTVRYLYRHDYITKEEFEHLTNTLAVCAMPNRKGFGQRLRERFFGKNKDEDSWVFPIVEVDPGYSNKTEPSTKPNLNVVDGGFKKDSCNE